jgi:hypothetical protein
MDGLKIFTEEIGEVESLPRDKVLDHLTQCAPDLKTEYLEHIIHRWSDKLPQFHNTLVLIYKEQIETKLETYVTSLKGRPRAKAGEEPDGLGFLRSKLLNFLQSSMHYKPENLISKFPANDLFEERALLLGRLGKHEVALAIYAHILKDPKMAEDYCKRIYDPENEENKEVYLHLIRVYLHPPSLKSLGINLPDKQSEDTEPTRDIITAMSILASYHEKIDTAKVMGMLPDDTKIQDIRSFLTTVLEENLVVKRRVHISRSLLLAEHLQVQKTRIKECSPHFTIDDQTLCTYCKKKLGTRFVH